MAAESSVSFGTLLRRYRSLTGLTQEELAERAKLGVRTIAYLESDRGGRPRADTVRQLAAALDLSPHEQEHFLGSARPEVAAPSASAGGRTAVAAARPGLHPLVGRQAVLTELDTHLGGQGRPVFLLAGEPGIGKTRLLREAARRAVGAGWTVLPGGCQRSGGQDPYSPLPEALQHHLAGYDPHALRRVLAGCVWLVRLLPELAGILEPLPERTIVPEQERRLMVQAITRLLANVSGTAGTLLILDDLQWAGQDSFALLSALVRRTLAPLQIVGAYRDTEVGPQSALGQFMADLAQAELIDLRTLGPLGGDEAATLLGYLLGGMPKAGSEVMERAGGVPFFLVSYAQALRAGGAGAVPWDLAAAVRQRVALAAEAAEILGIAAVMGRRVPRTLLLAVADAPPETVRSGLDIACRARLMLEDGADGYSFAHDVIREVIEADLGAARRAFLHGRVAAALEREESHASPELLAYHWGRSDTPARALVYLEAAAADAVKRYAYGQAERLYRELVARLDELGRRGEAARVREMLAELLRRIGRFAEAREVVGAALAWFETTSDLAGVGRNTAHLGLILDKQGESEEARRRLQEMAQRLERCGRATDAILTASALVWQQLATVHGGQGRYADMLAAADRASQIAGALGDGALRARAEERRGFALNCLGRIAEARQVLEAAIPMLQSTDALPEWIGAIGNLSENRRIAGDLEEALRLATEGLELAERTGMDSSVMAQHLNLADMYISAGDWKRAERHITCVREMEQSGGMSAYLAAFLPCAAGTLALRRGRWDEAVDQLSLAAERSAANNGWAGELARTLLAELDLMRGEQGRAMQRLTDLLALPEPNRAVILPVLAWAYLELGEPSHALQLAEEVATETRRRQTLFYLPDALRVKGMALSRLGRIAMAAEELTEGRDTAMAIPLPYTEARILVELGLLARQQNDDVRARDRIEDALAIFRRLGAAPDTARVEQMLATIPAG